MCRTAQKGLVAWQMQTLHFYLNNIYPQSKIDYSEIHHSPAFLSHRNYWGGGGGNLV